MRTIAVKSKTPTFIIGGFLLSGIVLLILGLALNKWIWIIGALIAVVSFALMVDYLVLPKVYLEVKGEKELVFLGKFTVPFHRVKNATIKKARSNGAEFEWGTVTVYTSERTFKLRYVEGCERVLKEISELCKR